MKRLLVVLVLLVFFIPVLSTFDGIQSAEKGRGWSGIEQGPMRYNLYQDPFGNAFEDRIDSPSDY